MELKNSFQRMFLGVPFVLMMEHAMHPQTVVGFQAHAFRLGNLEGQNGWSSRSSSAQRAVHLISIAGIQELQISDPMIASTSPAANGNSLNYATLDTQGLHKFASSAESMGEFFRFGELS